MLAAAAVGLMGVVATAPAASAADEVSDHLPFTGTYVVPNTWNHDGSHGGAAIDFTMPSGTQVRASGAGTVVGSGRLDCGGQYLGIYHASENRTSHYAHLSSRGVAVGAKVGRGQVIGLSGGTAGSDNCTKGAHLHYAETAGSVPVPPSDGRLDPGVMFACHGSATTSYGSWAGRHGFSARSDGDSCRSGTGVASPASGDLFAIVRNDRGQSSVHGMDNKTNFQKFWIQTLAGIHPTIDPARFEHRLADFNADGSADLYVFDRADAGQIAVHVLDGRSNFQNFLAHKRMQLPGTARFKLDAADYNGDGRAEVYAIDTNDTGRTAIHVLDAATHFSTFLIQTRSVLPESTNPVWSFAVADFGGDRKADVYAFNRSDTGRTAVHVLDAASNFQKLSIQTRTALPALHGTKWTLDAGDFDSDGRADIYAIDPADGDRTAVHVLSPTTAFQSFTMQTRTVLPATTDPVWAMSVAP